MKDLKTKFQYFKNATKCYYYYFKNATKFKRELTIPELENRGDKLASENAKALKHIFKSRTPTPVEHLLRS